MRGHIVIRKTILFFVGIVMTANAYAQGNDWYTGDIRPTGISGSVDKRTVIGWLGDRPSYVAPSIPNIWNTSPYNSIVRICQSSGCGTGDFISPRHVITNAHVSEECGMSGSANCQIYTSDGEILQGRVVFYGATGLSDRSKWLANIDKDWQILEIVDNYCRKEYRDFADGASATETGLWRAGFGSLRVLTNEDIRAIRAAYTEYVRVTNDGSSKGMLINDHDPNYLTKYKVFFDEFTRITGKDFNRDYNSDGHTLKLINNCKFDGLDQGIPSGRVVLHNCDAWGGDSGSTIKRKSNNNIVGLENEFWAYITTNEVENADGALLVYKFIYEPNIQSAIEKAKKDCENWKPDDPKPIKPEPKPDKKNCDLTCTNNTIVVAGTSGCYNFVENENKCLAATGKHLRSDGMANDGTFTYTCVGYNESSDCGGRFKPRPEPIPDSKKCDLICDNITITFSEETGCNKYLDNLETLEKRCQKATGHGLSIVNKTHNSVTYTCVGYNKSSDCVSTIKPEPKPDCELRCDNYTFTAKCIESSIGIELDRQCMLATGAKLVYDKNIHKTVCVNYDKSPVCTGTFDPKPEPIPEEREIGKPCWASDLKPHVIAGHYIGNGVNNLMCKGPKKCTCAATACEDGWYLAANAKGWSMGWCRSGICPRGKHPNIVGGNKMTGCVDD